MGLDAVVPCRCFEDGLLADPPAGIGELVRTPYGELAVKAFEEEGLNDQTAASFSPGAQDALRRFNEWAKAPCAHKWGYAWAEQIGNWASVREFRSLVGLLGTFTGVALGVLVSLNLGPVVGAFEQMLGVRLLPPGIYVISELPSDLRLEDVSWVALISCVLALLATIYPSLRAAAVRPAEALRYE